jgi:DNA-binding response OmpR family regulator
MSKVLVVDDDEDVLEVVTYILKSQGFEVCTHTTGLKVAEVVEKQKPNLILLDIRLPGKLGTEVYKELKQLYSTPILFFSAHADKEKTLRDYPAEGFVQKPFDIDTLVRKIRSHLN